MTDGQKSAAQQLMVMDLFQDADAALFIGPLTLAQIVEALEEVAATLRQMEREGGA